MTDKEIKALARQRVSSNGGDCISLIVFLFAVIALVALFEVIAYIVFKALGWGYLYDLRQIFTNKKTGIFWLVKSLVEIILCIPEFFSVRRLFIDIARGKSLSETREYISAHSITMYKNAVRSSLIHNLIKLFAAVPGMVGIYGIYYWSYVCKINELTSAGLFALMLSVGFTVVWIGVAGHYYISLALTPYIMALNPRTNIFDACDLSVKLMDGKHFRYVKFLASFIKFIPTLLLVYPCFAIYPYFKVCYTLLMDEFLGSYKQDKLPGMIKRWRKYQ